MIQLGCPPKRIDLLTSAAGVDFETSWERRAELRVGGRSVPFLGLDDLIVNERAVGRPQDLADVAALEGRDE